jgi:arsenate reductase
MMAEVGIDISQHQSSVIDSAMIDWATLVITVCGHADEACPTLPQGVKRIHWPTPDPAAFTGTHEEVKAGFRAVRDSLKERITDLLI